MSCQLQIRGEEIWPICFLWETRNNHRAYNVFACLSFSANLYLGSWRDDHYFPLFAYRILCVQVHEGKYVIIIPLSVVLGNRYLLWYVPSSSTYSYLCPTLTLLNFDWAGTHLGVGSGEYSPVLIFQLKFFALLLLKLFYFAPHFDRLCALFPWNHDFKIALSGKQNFQNFPNGTNYSGVVENIVECKSP